MVLPAPLRLIGVGDMTMTTYRAGHDNDAGPEIPFSGLEAAFDPVSRHQLAATGLEPGWDCWEVGAGTGGVARWLADSVGPTGSVLATDVAPTLMRPGRRSNLEVVGHDLVWDPLPARRFHCIHARLVLGHLPEREDLLARLASALLPGGWLVIEDLELVLPPCPEVATPDQRLVYKVRSGFAQLLTDLRGDARWACRLARRLRALGLVDVESSAYMAPVTGGSVVSSIERSHLVVAREQLVGFGVATDDELDRCLQLLDDPGFRFAMPPLVSAWGRRI